MIFPVREEKFPAAPPRVIPVTAAPVVVEYQPAQTTTQFPGVVAVPRVMVSVATSVAPLELLADWTTLMVMAAAVCLRLPAGR